MRVSVIGQGYVGLTLAIGAANAGHSVIGLDLNSILVSNLSKGDTFVPGISKKNILELIDQRTYIPTTNTKLIYDSEIVILSVPTPLKEDRSPDLSFIFRACEIIAQNVLRDALIINESTSFPGTLRNLIKPAIEKNSKQVFSYAASPERVDPGSTIWNLANTPRIIAGLTSNASDKAFEFYGSFCQQIYRVSCPEVAEAAKLLENTFRQINIAFVNEFSLIANKLNFSTHEAITAAATKPFGFMPFFPSIGVGGHCIPVDPNYLAFSAENAGVEAKFINLANEVNLSMPALVTGRIKSHLNGDLKGKRIQLAGITYKPDIPDLRESPALNLIKELKIAGAIISWHDPFVKDYEGQQSVALTSEIDLGLIVTPHSQIDFSIWKKANVKVLDLSANSTDYGWPKFL